MLLLIIIGSLLCNVLIAWAMLQKPFFPPLDNPYPCPHHKTKTSGLTLLFEPQPKIQLTQLSYKVTSFLVSIHF